MRRCTPRGACRRPRRALWLLPVLAAVLIPALARATSDAPLEEVRGLWVLRSTLTSPQAIATMVRRARANGFNTLLVQVRGRGDAYFNGHVEARAPELATQPLTFDPLQETLAAARELDLRVHAWVTVNLIASATDLPSERAHVIYRHPEWLMVPRAMAREMAQVDPNSPAYLGKLARWARAQISEVEGLYASPVQADAAAYAAAVVSDLVEHYAVDGVHLDYVRYPNDEFDYSRPALAEFRADIAPTLPVLERRRLDARASADPLTYPETFPERWSAFRRSRLTSLVQRLRTVVKAHRPAAVFSAAVVPDLAEAYGRHLQDWRTWLEAGFLDVACPLAYTEDPATFAEQIAAARQVAGMAGLWAGVGAYQLPSAQTIEHILTARRLGATGVVLFSYDSLTNPAEHRADYLTRVGQVAFGDRRASLGAR